MSTCVRRVEVGSSTQRLWWRSIDSMDILGLGRQGTDFILSAQFPIHDCFFFPSKSPSPLPLPFSLSGSKWSSCWASSGFREVRWPFPSSYSLPLPAPKVDTMDPLMALLCLLSLYSGRSMGERMWGSCGWGWCYPGWVSMGKTNSLLCFPLLVCAFLLFSISALCLHAHRLGCSCSLLPSERENLRRQFHPQPWLGSWECPHLLLSPGLLSITSVSAVLEQRTVADPKSHPVHKGSLQT